MRNASFVVNLHMKPNSLVALFIGSLRGVGGGGVGGLNAHNKA